MLAALCASGCASSEAPQVRVADWQLVPSAGEPVALTLPAHFNEHLPERPVDYALTANVQLPASLRGRHLVLAIPYFRADVELLVNGVPAPSLDAVRSGSYRGLNHPRFSIRAQDSSAASLRLVLRVRHTWTQSAWLDTVPVLSATARGDRWFLFVRDFNYVTALFALGSALIIGFQYALLYGRHRSAGPHGWFALEAVAALTYPLHQLGLSQSIFGVYDTPVMLVMVTTAVVASVYFTHVQFGLGRPSRVWPATAVACAVVAIAASGPYRATSIVAPVTILSVVANVSYQLWLTAKVWRETRNPNAAVLVVSWAALGIFGATDFIVWGGLGDLTGGLRGACLGIGVIATLQAVVLGVEHVDSLRRADALNVELVGRVELLERTNREIAVLNDELRHQVSARAGELSRALESLTRPTSGEVVELAVGDVVDERYRIVGHVGSGGMGVVYRVQRVTDGTEFAFKVLGGIVDGMRVARFAREAKIIADISHPNVVSVVDVHVSSAGYLYFVMELVEGQSLSGYLAAPPSRDWSLAVIRQIVVGLGAVHALGVVHRDLKPANVLIAGGDTPTPTVKLGDFGIARVQPGATSSGSASGSSDDSAPPEADVPTQSIAGDTGVDTAATTSGRMPVIAAGQDPPTASMLPADLTKTGALMGTPRYMAPEVASRGARAAKPASDMFSLGVIAYELLGGVAPYTRQVNALRLMGHAVPAPKPLAQLAEGLDAQLAGLIDLCLADAADRRPTAEALIAVLDPLTGRK